MKFQITEEQINIILAYLSRCPYADVYKLVELIQGLTKQAQVASAPDDKASS